jgi:hypothetical protein
MLYDRTIVKCQIGTDIAGITACHLPTGSTKTYEKFQSKQLAANQDLSMPLQEGKYSTLPLWQASR